MTGRTGSNHPGGRESIDKVRQLQRRLWSVAKRQPGRRFHALLDRIYRRDVLWEAWRRVKRNRGAAGIDAMTLADGRASGRRGISRRPRRAAARRHVSARGGAASIHSEGGRKTATIGDSDGPRPSGADGGDAGAGADFRGGLPSVLVRLPAEAERHAGAGNTAQAWRARRQSRPRRRHSRLLREHRPRQATDAGGTAHLGPAGAQADTAVASGRRDGRRAASARPSRGRRKAA